LKRVKGKEGRGGQGSDGKGHGTEYKGNGQEQERKG